MNLFRIEINSNVKNGVFSFSSTAILLLLDYNISSHLHFYFPTKSHYNLMHKYNKRIINRKGEFTS